MVDILLSVPCLGPPLQYLDQISAIPIGLIFVWPPPAPFI